MKKQLSPEQNQIYRIRDLEKRYRRIFTKPGIFINQTDMKRARKILSEWKKLTNYNA